MKPRLPCCEINLNNWNRNWSCEHCECFFQKKKMMENHTADIHKILKVSKKRKVGLKGRIAAKKIYWNWPCKYCEHAFVKRVDLEIHIESVHKCSTCWEIVLKSDEQDHARDHAEMNKREKEEKEDIKRKKKQFYDDFVEQFIVSKKLNEYQSDKSLNVDYIIKNYRKEIGNEELLFFARYGMKIFNNYKYISDEEIIFLLDNDAISEKDASYFININQNINLHEAQPLIDYFLKKNFHIKSKWVAKHIENDALIKRIQEKHNFTFEKVFSKCIYWGRESRQKCYKAVHKHFPDPAFVEYRSPKDFACITTNHVIDYLHSRYFYDEENDELWIVVGHDDRKISLGRCKKLIEQENLCELIAKYHDTMEHYVKASKEVSALFEEIDEISDQKEAAFLRKNLYKVYLPERNNLANSASHTYFVIAQKPDTVPTLECLAMKEVVKEDIKFDQLPSLLKQKVVELKDVLSICLAMKKQQLQTDRAQKSVVLV